LKILDYHLVSQQFRKEGFKHQELAVLPGPIQEESRRHCVLKNLHVTDAGFFPEAIAHRRDRPQGAPGAIIIVCLAGLGWVKFGAGILPVRPGQVILIAPDEPHSYGADLSDAWTIVWAHFRGQELDFWWRLLEIPKQGGIISARCHSPAQLELDRVHEQLTAGYDESRQLAAAAALRWSLAKLAGAGEAATGERNEIESVVGWMLEHIGQRVTVRALARRAGLSPAHFSLCFKKQTGFAPIDYFLRLKIRRACKLLDGTKWAVERIARELGYDDAFYFSRLFRSIMGCPPKDYRNNAKG
jgi:AraC family transcriptional regulator of arabinose operon